MWQKPIVLVPSACLNTDIAATGALLGGGRGAVQALRTPLEVTADSGRLRLNRLLNVSGRSGRTAGNALGVLGLLYACSDSGLGYLSDGRTPDTANSLAAGKFLGWCAPCT